MFFKWISIRTFRNLSQHITSQTAKRFAFISQQTRTLGSCTYPMCMYIPRICSVSLGILFNDFLLSTHYTCLFVLLLLFLIAFRIHRIYKMHVWCSDKSVVWVVLNTFHKFNISKSGCFSFSTDTLSFALCLLLSASRSVGVWSGQFRCDMWQILDENGTPSHMCDQAGDQHEEVAACVSCVWFLHMLLKAFIVKWIH